MKRNDATHRAMEAEIAEDERLLTANGASHIAAFDRAHFMWMSAVDDAVAIWAEESRRAAG